MNLPLKLLVGEDGGGLRDGDGSLRGGDGGLGRSLGAGRMTADVGASERGGRRSTKEPRCGEARPSEWRSDGAGEAGARRCDAGRLPLGSGEARRRWGWD